MTLTQCFSRIGRTQVSQGAFHEWLRGIAHRFTPQTYSLLNHNCNNFSSEVCRFLTGQDIPSYITGLPADALNSPMGMMLRPMIENMERQAKMQGGNSHPGFVPWNENSRGPDLFLPPVPDHFSTTQTTPAPKSAPSERKDKKTTVQTNHTLTQRKNQHRHCRLPLSVVSMEVYLTAKFAFLVAWNIRIFLGTSTDIRSQRCSVKQEYFNTPEN
jgi:hypothetical protein